MVARGWEEVWGFLLGDENVLELDRGGVCTIVNVLNAIELYSLKWLILCYMSFATIKKEKNKGEVRQLQCDM